MNINLCGRRRFSPQSLNNLSLTKQLRIWDDWYREPPEPNTYRWRQCRKCTDMCENGDIGAIQKAKFVWMLDFLEFLVLVIATWFTLFFSTTLLLSGFIRHQAFCQTFFDATKQLITESVILHEVNLSANIQNNE